ncbi:MAG: molybdate ABC transporter substrate-binding protein [Acidimicrobiia bacterium]|nr:molybdate ABC transporter substrate-binding protein [Acidimicrobiia bacterium]
MRRATLLIVLFVGLLGLVVSCGSDGDDGSTSDGSTTSASGAGAASELSGEITVAAAASLTEAYTKIGADFEAANPDTKVTFTFDSSGTLSEQIVRGAPVDVFASADEANMTKLVDQDLVDGEPTLFARNELAIVAEPGNPEGIETLADLADVGIVSLCGEDVPCGKFANQVLSEAGVEISESSVTRGQNVKATLTAVTEGDAVAGIVYVTDAQSAADQVETITIPRDENAIAVYPVGVLREAGNAEVAQAFADYVASDDGQVVLKSFGFLPPS